MSTQRGERTGRKRPDLAARNRGEGIRLYEDAEWIRARYFDELKSFIEIAAEAGCGQRTIARWFHAHGFVAPTHHERRELRGNTLRGNRSPQWRDEIGYAPAHFRVAAARGRAASHHCVTCNGPAANWAYDHTDPNEKTDPQAGPYSLDVWRYQAMCIPCHRRFDKAFRTP